MLSILLATSLACGGASKSSGGDVAGRDVTIGFSSAAMQSAADTLTIAVDGTTVATVSQAASATFAFANANIKVAPGTHTITLTATLGAPPAPIVASGSGTVTVPATGAVLVTIKVNSGANAAKAPDKGFVINTFSITNDATLTGHFSVSVLSAGTVAPVYKWSQTGCTGGTWTDGAGGAIAGSSNLNTGATFNAALASVRFTVPSAQICKVTVNVRDNNDGPVFKSDSSKSATVGLGDVNVGILSGEIAPPVITSVTLFDEAQVAPFNTSCKVTRPVAAYPAVPFAGDLVCADATAASTLANATLVGATSITLGAGKGALYTAPGQVKIDVGALEEVVTYTAVTGDVLTVPALAFAHAKGAAVVQGGNGCKFNSIAAVVGTDVCTGQFQAIIPPATPADFIAWVAFDLAGVYDATNPPTVSVADASGGTGSSGVFGIDPVQWYQTSANTSLVGAKVGTALLTWTPPAIAGTYVLTATINNQGVVDTFPLFVFLQ